MSYISIIGFTAAFCTTFCFIPQALKVIKTRDTNSISLLSYVFLNIGVLLWLVYGICKKDFAIITSNGVTLIFVFTILCIKIKNK